MTTQPHNSCASSSNKRKDMLTKTIDRTSQVGLPGNPMASQERQEGPNGIFSGTHNYATPLSPQKTISPCRSTPIVKTMLHLRKETMRNAWELHLRTFFHGFGLLQLLASAPSPLPYAEESARPPGKSILSANHRFHA